MKRRSVYTAVFSVALASMGAACATERKAEDEHPRLVLAGEHQRGGDL